MLSGVTVCIETIYKQLYAACMPFVQRTELACRSTHAAEQRTSSIHDARRTRGQSLLSEGAIAGSLLQMSCAILWLPA